MPFVEVIELDRCRAGAGTFVAIGGHELAVFRLSQPDRVVVIDNACPHSSGNLSAGSVEVNVVTCPSHKWRFDLDRGVCTHSALARVRKYEVEIRQGVVWVDLPARAID